MEIHPPTHPVSSLREFLIHLSMVTIGVLIALGLEQTVEAWHHHELGVEARENILNEIRDNTQVIENARPVVAKNKAALQSSLDIVRLYLSHKAPAEGKMRIAVNGASLSSTSWTTAAATGALSYMGYTEAKRFAAAYAMQAILQHAQDDMVQTSVQAYSGAAFNPKGSGDLSNLREDQLRELERQLKDCLGSVVYWDQVAGQLIREYGRVLQAK